MAFTNSDLAALDSAIALGALEVQYSDKKVTYRSLHEMLQLRELMKAELNPTANNSGRRYGSFSKGLI